MRITPVGLVGARALVSSEHVTPGLGLETLVGVVVSRKWNSRPPNLRVPLDKAPFPLVAMR